MNRARLLACAALLLAASAASAEPPQPLLDRLRSGYAQVKSLELEATITEAYDVAGRRREHQATYRSALASDGRFRHEIEGQLIVAGDAGNTWVYVPSSLRYYRTERTPEAPRELDPAARQALIDHNLSLYLALSPDAAAAVEALGEVEAEADRLVVRQKDGSVMRISLDAATGLLATIETDVAVSLKESGAPQVGSAIRRVTYASVRVNQPVADESVAFAPPDQAQEVERAGAAGGGSNLAGKPAPELSLPDLEGKPVALPELAGKVVIVDFWASWCGPCVRGMPHLQGLADQHAAAGLVVLAVNLKEDEPTIRQFLAAQSLKSPPLRVLRDADGEAAARWGVTGIPMTAVIGRDGKVREVVVGLAPEKVSKAVEAALAEPSRNAGSER